MASASVNIISDTVAKWREAGHLTKPFDINPIRGHALPVRGRHRFGGHAGSTITVPGTEEYSLVPLGEARLGRIAFDEWLRRSSTAK